jgi:regulator of sigma E protease
MDLEPFIHEFITIASAVKKPLFVDKNGDVFYLSLIQNPSSLGASIEEIAGAFTGTAYLYKVLDKSQDIKLDPKSETLISVPGAENVIAHLRAKDLYPVELSIRNIVMGSPADKAGLKKDDILLSINGSPLSNFEELRNNLQAVEENKEVEISFLSKGTLLTKKLIPETKLIENKKTKIIGLESAVEYVEPKLVIAKAGNFAEAITGAFNRTWDGVVKTFSGYKKLITREVSLNNIGGPLAIGKVASDSFNISLSMFFRLMAIISINLGVINLFPIPVLDGGHIMFLVFETLNGGPLSKRKLEIAQRFGVSVLFFLIFIALFNDISRLF